MEQFSSISSSFFSLECSENFLSIIEHRNSALVICLISLELQNIVGKCMEPAHHWCWIYVKNPMDTGAWQATVHGVPRVGHDLATKPPPPYLVKG